MTREAVYHPHADEPIYLEPHDPLLHFLQRIRDEAHRFAITFHKKTRAKKTIRSELDLIPGIGPVKKKKLLQAFGSVQEISKRSLQELTDVPGITKKDAVLIRSYFANARTVQNR
jgi:excinuclease ABC subunit C